MFYSLLLLLFCAENVLADKREIAVVVFRHGARTPVAPYPNDPYQENTWPEGWGQLTEEGKKQEYHLGGLFKRRYIDSGYISSIYRESQIYLRSTDYDRTQISARFVFANMYPPRNGDLQDFNALLRWQPRTLPVKQDLVTPSVPGTPKCPAYDEALLTDWNIYVAIERKNWDFFRELEGYTGMKVNVFTVPFLTDTLYIEYTNNLTMPDWFTVKILARLIVITDVLIYLTVNTNEEKRLTGGVWADTVLNLFERKAANNRSSLQQKKLYVYSAHDITVADMMSVFGLYKGIRPPYSAAFIIELYSRTVAGQSKEYYVKFLYHARTWSNKLLVLRNRHCTGEDGRCLLQSLLNYMQQNRRRLTPTQWRKACKPKRPRA